MGLLEVVKYAYQQITDLCNGKIKAITAPIVNFAFVLLYSFKGTNRIGKVVEFAILFLIHSFTMGNCGREAMPPSVCTCHYGLKLKIMIWMKPP